LRLKNNKNRIFNTLTSIDLSKGASKKKSYTRYSAYSGITLDILLFTKGFSMRVRACPDRKIFTTTSIQYFESLLAYRIVGFCVV